MKFNKKIKNKIKKHALEDFPDECCGLVIEESGEQEACRCDNESKDKKNFFRIGIKDYLKATKKGKILACYHSHTEEHHDLDFSEFDKEVSDSHGVPLIMYSIREDKFKEHIPS